MIIYDCEIKKMILGRNEVYQDGVEYCKGWSDYTGMGVSVVCAFDTDTNTMHTFQPEDNDDHASTLQNLINRADYVVGFNNHSFDNKLMAANNITIPVQKSYDIYEQIIKAAGLDTAPFAARKGYKLDDIARANFIEGKGGTSGALAPIMYQNGELDKLYDYCQHDVEITYAVLRLILEHNLTCPRQGGILAVDTPRMLLGTVQSGLF